jgi:hypothetical protein
MSIYVGAREYEWIEPSVRARFGTCGVALCVGHASCRLHGKKRGVLVVTENCLTLFAKHGERLLELSLDRYPLVQVERIPRTALGCITVRASDPSVTPQSIAFEVIAPMADDVARRLLVLVG